jgi:deoxyadenosine/deoxycytidine kinase
MALYEPMFPEMLVYLNCKPETAMARIRRRGRAMEQGVQLDYLKALQDAYLEFLDEMKVLGVRIVMVDWEEFMPLSRLVDQISVRRAALV